jgi:alpha-L-fucosidase
MRFGTYYSGGLDWTFGGLPITDLASMFAAIPQSAEYLGYADAHWRELIERYRPDVLWNDIGYPAAADLDGLFADYYAVVPDGVVNNRFDWMAQSSGARHCDFTTPEYSTTGDPNRKWEATRGIGTSFGYNRQEPESSYLAPDRLVQMFVDVVAHGGNLLLNVGPTAPGEIPWVQAQRLLALGWWLRTNGPAIYGSRPWERAEGATAAGEGVRFTRGADGALHAIVLGTPEEVTVELVDLELPSGARVELLGHAGPLTWENARSAAVVRLPGRPAEAPALTLRITPPG